MKNNEEKYKSGFKVPDSYFEDLGDKLLSIVSEEELPKNSGFKVPDNYFESLEEKVLSKTIQTEEVKVISIFSRKSVWYASGIAATLLLLFFTWTPNTINPSTFEIAEIESYINNDNLDIEMQDIAQILNEENLDDFQMEVLSISEENIENYLLESLDDTTLLIE